MVSCKEKIIYGHALRDTMSIGNNRFLLKKGEFVIITRKDIKKNIIECLWEGSLGIFNLNDIVVSLGSPVKPERLLEN